jgi:electron-transferring-flavoprotein dehydrogenase
MSNKGNYIVSLSDVVKWLAEKAEEIGVEIFPGIAASELLYNEDGSLKGIATNDVGIGKNGEKKASFEPGMEIHPRMSIFAEGCRGSLSKKLTEKFALRKNCSHQTYGIGIKELWEVNSDLYKAGTVTHTVGWPMDIDTYGGSWTYHMNDNQVSIGLVVALDYKNPHLNPYKEFQVISSYFVDRYQR